MLVSLGAFFTGCSNNDEAQLYIYLSPQELIVGQWNKTTTIEGYLTVTLEQMLIFNEDGTWSAIDTISAGEEPIIMESQGTWGIDEDYILTRVTTYLPDSINGKTV